MSTTTERGVGAASTSCTVSEEDSPLTAAGRVRREHAMLRALLDDVERASIATRTLRPGGLEELLRSIWELHVSFEEHLTMEEHLVVPILRAGLPFGDMRAAALIEEHSEQRRRLLQLVTEAERAPTSIDALVTQATALVTTFRADMLAEEGVLAAAIDVA